MIAAKKQLLCTLLGFIVVNIVHSYRPRTPKRCNVPNGSRGTCTPLSQCQPLLDISTTSDRGSSEHTFYIECRALCTDNMVCCPPESEWPNLQYNPIEYQTPPIKHNADNSQEYKCGIQPSTQRIVGGHVVGIYDYPWLALLDYMDSEYSKCAGILITNRFVVTAAHCIETSNGAPIRVRLAEYNTSSYPTDTVINSYGVPESVNVTIIDVEWSIKYPSNNSVSKWPDDIGLIKMSESVQFSDFIKPICLPEIDFASQVPIDTRLITAGWGLDDSYGLSEIKKAVDLPYRPLSDCQDITSTPLAQERQICAGGEEGKDSCRGDSGGPLMYVNGTRFVLIGIVSFGYYVCGIGPAVYTNVYNYLDWIKRYIE